MRPRVRLRAGRLLAVGLLAVSATPVPAQDTNLPDADGLLRACVGTLPDVPLRVTGELQSRGPGGDLEKKVNVEMLIDWQAVPPAARYSTRDAFGKALEHLAVTWHTNSAPEYRFFRGDPLVAAPLPPLTDRIEDTDVSWMDLTLAYLWWPDGQTRGAEEVRGRTCWVLDIPAPTNHFGAADGVRLWLDSKMGAVLRAQVHGPGGEVLRRVDVKGFKKIGDRWFVQVIEVESLPARHTTTLRVREVEDRQRKQFIRVDEGGPEPGSAEEAEPVTPLP